jgi:hypothetical protein
MSGNTPCRASTHVEESRLYRYDPIVPIGGVDALLTGKPPSCATVVLN